MEGYAAPLKMKRKEIEEVNDEFSDFSLSSPARKIRRLDAELPPIMEEDETDVPVVFEDKAGGNVVIEELPHEVAGTEERAIVLFKPMNASFLLSPSGFSVNPDLISGFKNQLLWPRKSDLLKATEDEAEGRDTNSGAANECLAVVPWVSSQFPQASGAEDDQNVVPDSMEAEETEAAAMDVEDDYVDMEQRPGNQELGGMAVSEGLHQWQQQHCMIPQPPQHSPIVWFR
ncbi:hypothetical protein RJ639_047045 [Escallonia herrerae]|uniref:Uncharacterized protein n=1 Tax=Escallonia herrerae TaxID=1293975 RepID=A0AA88WH81_9ASTE|nr:hypothetical protein RJ639_047045 [Escallonia herrerae]